MSKDKLLSRAVVDALESVDKYGTPGVSRAVRQRIINLGLATVPTRGGAWVLSSVGREALRYYRTTVYPW